MNAVKVREMRLAVSQILAESSDLDEAAPRLLEAVSRALGWQTGGLWLPDDATEELHCAWYWQDPDRPSGDFRAVTLELAFLRGDTLPGRVWRSGRPEWVEDVTEDPAYVRAPQATQEGLHAAFAFPVGLGDDILGVLEFYSRAIEPPDEDLLELSGTLGHQIGQFIERHRAEAGLRRSEQDLSDFFDNATMGLHWVGPDGTVLRANRCELELLGYEEEEYVGHHIAEFHADQEVIDDILERLAANEQLRDYPARMVCKDGSIRHVLINSNVLREDGEFIHTRCFTRDVTDRMRLQEELERRVEELTEAEARVRSVVDHVVDGIITIDTEGTIQSFNPAAEAIFGYRADEVLGENVKVLMPAPYRQEHDRYLETYHRTGEAKIIGSGREVVGRRKDGTVFPLDLAVSEFRHAGRRIYTGIVRDITERRRLEDALRFLSEASRSLSALQDSRSTLQQIARLAVPGFADWSTVHMLDEDGEVESLAISHVDPGKVPEVRRLYSVLPQEARNDGGLLSVLRTGEAERMARLGADELRLLGGGGEASRLLEDLRPTSLLSVPLHGDGGVMGAMTFVYSESGGHYRAGDLEMARDLAHRASIAIDNARLYEKLREADRRKDEFLAMLSHELRNPLAPIRHGLEILAMRHGQDRVINSMRQQVVHLVRLVDDLLDVSRIMRGRVELRPEVLDLADLVRRSVDSVRPAIEQRDQDLHVSLPDRAVSLYADPVRLAQVLENLLGNASKYTERGGRIAIGASVEEGEVEIAVEDSGVGIEPKLLPHVFDLFTQSLRSLERSQGGLGIGLTLVQRLVSLHHGTVSAESPGPGEGSRFTVRLPLGEPPEVAAVEESAAPVAEVGGRRILVVDDNVEAAEMLSVLLRAVGDHQVEMAYDGSSALEMVRRGQPEIVLLDIGLPGLDGYEVGRRIREEPQLDAPLLVAVTGYGQEEDRRKSLQAGFDEHLVKPVSITEIERVLTHRKLAG